MRRVNYLWLVLAAACGAVLFHTSQRVTDGREQLASIDRDIAKEQESTRVLEAEWSYLNQPDRLEKLSRQYLHLEPMRGRQFASVEKLDAAPAVAEKTETPAAPKIAEAAPAQETPLAAKPQAPVEKQKLVLKPPAVSPLAAASLPKPHVAQKKPEKHPAHAVAKTQPQHNFNDLMKSLGVN